MLWGLLYVLLALALLWDTVQGCVTDTDCGSLDDAQPGLCFSGVCQCGVGYGNAVNTTDPSVCALVCVPPPIPDATTFLSEPTVEVTASGGQLVVSVSIAPFLKQTPTTMAFLHPVNGTRCSLLPLYLGSQLWTQTVSSNSTNTTDSNNVTTVASTCINQYDFRAPFADTVSESPCWLQQPDISESAAQSSITYSVYSTLVEVIQNGFGPVNQAERAANDVALTLAFRRNYTIQIARSFSLSSVPFQAAANGGILYRLVKIDYDILHHAIIATVQTQTAVAAKLANVRVSAGAAILGVTNVLNVTTPSDCDSNSPVGKCNQFHAVSLSDSPCSVSGAELVLSARFVCANGSDASTCGFFNLPVNDTYTLGNMFLTYDSCPRVVVFGVDSANSYLRLHTDVARRVPLTQQTTLGTVLFGRASVVPSAGASFQSISLTSLNVVSVDVVAGNTDLGNQLSSTFMTLLSTATQTTPNGGIWDFDLFLDANFFSPVKVYYLIGTFAMTFANTGTLVRREILPIIGGDLIASMQHVRRAEFLPSRAGATVNQGVFSQTFRMGVVSTTQSTGTTKGITSSSFTGMATTTASSSGGPPIAMVAGIICAVVLVGAAVVIVLVIIRKKRKQIKGIVADGPIRTEAPSSVVYAVKERQLL